MIPINSSRQIASPNPNGRIHAAFKGFAVIARFSMLLVPGLCSGGDSWDSSLNWLWRNPLPTGNALNDVTFGKGHFIAVGALGTVLVSANGSNWIQRFAGTTDNLSSVAFGNERFVAV